MKRIVSVPLLAALLAAAVPVDGPAAARDFLAGPIEAKVERVVDGDTIAVKAHIWVDHEVAVMVRLRGIDAPERRGHCAAERSLARRAAAYLAAATAAGRVTLTEISGGKYFGRVIATVTTAEGGDVARSLMRAGLVEPYHGRARASWCAAE